LTFNQVGKGEPKVRTGTWRFGESCGGEVASGEGRWRVDDTHLATVNKERAYGGAGS